MVLRSLQRLNRIHRRVFGSGAMQASISSCHQFTGIYRSKVQKYVELIGTKGRVKHPRIGKHVSPEICAGLFLRFLMPPKQLHVGSQPVGLGLGLLPTCCHFPSVKRQKLIRFGTRVFISARLCILITEQLGSLSVLPLYVRVTYFKLASYFNFSWIAAQ